MKSLFTLVFALTVTSVYAAPKKFEPARLLKRLTCTVSRISDHTDDHGFDTQSVTQYAGYTFIRTDIGEPDGVLTITRDGKDLCKINISLTDGIYFSTGDRLLILDTHSGSGRTLQVYDLAKTCVELGYVNISDTKSAKDFGAAILENSDRNHSPCTKP